MCSCVFEGESNEELHEVVGQPLVESAIKGYNGTLLAYGQTGSGKTFTIGEVGRIGTPHEGVAHRMVRSLFDHIATDATNTYEVKLQFVQIHVERIYDLFGDDNRASNQRGAATSLRLREDASSGVYVQGAVSEEANTAEQALGLLQAASTRLAFASTNMNLHSSRSHAVCQLSVVKTPVRSPRATRSPDGGRSPRTPVGGRWPSASDLLSKGEHAQSGGSGGVPALPTLKNWRRRSVEILTDIIQAAAFDNKVTTGKLSLGAALPAFALLHTVSHALPLTQRIEPSLRSRPRRLRGRGALRSDGAYPRRGQENQYIPPRPWQCNPCPHRRQRQGCTRPCALSGLGAHAAAASARAPSGVDDRTAAGPMNASDVWCPRDWYRSRLAATARRRCCAASRRQRSSWCSVEPNEPQTSPERAPISHASDHLAPDCNFLTNGQADVAETLSTLRFGGRAKRVRNFAQVNATVDVNALAEELQARLTAIPSPFAIATAHADPHRPCMMCARDAPQTRTRAPHPIQ